MASALHPSQVPSRVKDPTRTEQIEKNITAGNEILANLLQRLGGAVQRLSGPWPTPERGPTPKPPSADGNHAARMDGLAERTATLLSELESIVTVLERYV